MSSLQVLDIYVAGNYSYTKACIRLERLSAIYVMQISLACLIVLLSYLGSWIAPTAAPGRIALGIISILIVANNYQSVQRSLPKVAYNVFMMDFLLGALVFNVVTFISCARYPYLACSPVFVSHACQAEPCPLALRQIRLPTSQCWSTLRLSRFEKRAPPRTWTTMACSAGVSCAELCSSLARNWCALAVAPRPTHSLRQPLVFCTVRGWSSTAGAQARL